MNGGSPSSKSNKTSGQKRAGQPSSGAHVLQRPAGVAKPPRRLADERARAEVLADQVIRVPISESLREDLAGANHVARRWDLHGLEDRDADHIHDGHRVSHKQPAFRPLDSLPGGAYKIRGA
jgi:hypothetical protein